MMRQRATLEHQRLSEGVDDIRLRCMLCGVALNGVAQHRPTGLGVAVVTQLCKRRPGSRRPGGAGGEAAAAAAGSRG